MKVLSLIAFLSLMSLASERAGATFLFSDLGSGGPPYAAGSIVQGSGLGSSLIQARPFTVAGTGQFDVTQIDMDVVRDTGNGSFTASIWTSVVGQPGAPIASPWTLITTINTGSSGLTTMTGITGVTLTGGNTYFMAVGPATPGDFNREEWVPNNQGATASYFASLNGGAAWVADGTGTNAAFDVIGVTSVPEPATRLLFPATLGALFARRRRTSARAVTGKL